MWLAGDDGSEVGNPSLRAIYGSVPSPLERLLPFLLREAARPAAQVVGGAAARTPAPGWGTGCRCAGSSIGLMAVLVALDVMSLFRMSVVAVLACVQKLLPAKAAIDIPLALIGLGLVIAPSLVPGLTPSTR
jgi:predicted metal-binding integral membrane protein DUF2182